MNEQYLEERVYPSENVEGIDKRTNSPVENSDPFADKVPMDAALIQQTPMGGTVVAVGPMNETMVSEEPVSPAVPYTAPVAETIAYQTPVVVTRPNEVPASTNIGSSAALLDREESDHFRTRWNKIQGTFVDEPRAAVQQADELVSEVIGQITQMFAKNHSSLEGQWKQGNDVSTEDLRKALQQYRAFFNRLVV